MYHLRYGNSSEYDILRIWNLVAPVAKKVAVEGVVAEDFGLVNDSNTPKSQTFWWKWTFVVTSSQSTWYSFIAG